MSTQEDQFHQFQIPNSGTFDVPLTDNPHWDAADEVMLSQNMTGSTILDDQPHDPSRWHEALTYDERLGLTEAEADVERRQREIDFNENQTETAANCRELMAEIENTANIVMDLRERFRNDEGVINGVKVTGNV